jgi:hypothetical protein
MLPYQSMVYTLTDQEANALKFHCKQHRFQTCQVTAFDVHGKKVFAKLDVSFIFLRTTILDTHDNVVPMQAGAF